MKAIIGIKRLNPIRILIVDDAADNRHLLENLLQDDYQTISVDSGQKCLELIAENPPDLVLLDINMPKMDGYQVCEAIRQQSLTEFLPVVFVSAFDSVEERLKGFEVGGDDYIIKPVDGDKLLETVQFKLKKRQQETQAQKQAEEAMKVAMEAMTSSSELGEIIQYVQCVQSLNSIQSVIDAFIEACSKLGLTACAIWPISKTYQFAGCQQDSIEAKLLRRFVPNGERIITIGIRCFLVSDNFVVLIKNMPVDDQSRFGRLKDHIAVLQDIACGRIVSIQSNEKVGADRQQLIHEIIGLAESNIKSTSQKIDTFSQDINRTMTAMIHNLENMLFSLGLEEDQEIKLMKLAEQTSTELHKSTRHTEQLDTDLGQVLEALYQLLDKDTTSQKDSK